MLIRHAQAAKRVVEGVTETFVYIAYPRMHRAGRIIHGWGVKALPCQQGIITHYARAFNRGDLELPFALYAHRQTLQHTIALAANAAHNRTEVDKPRHVEEALKSKCDISAT